jgi:hypothetical protein
MTLATNPSGGVKLARHAFDLSACGCNAMTCAMMLPSYRPGCRMPDSVKAGGDFANCMMEKAMRRELNVADSVPTAVRTYIARVAQDLAETEHINFLIQPLDQGRIKIVIRGWRENTFCFQSAKAANCCNNWPDDRRQQLGPLVLSASC